MRSPRPHFLSTVLAALCGLWLVVAPVLPQLHQALAKHRHVFCVEHDRVEDRAPSDAHAWHDPSQAVDRRGSSVRKADSALVNAQTGAECLSSNFSAQAIFRASVCVWGRTPVCPLPAPALSSVAVSFTDTLRLAPKTSPPVT